MRRSGCAARPSACVAALVLAGCQAPLSTLDPAGPAAARVAALWWVMLVGAAAIWLLTMLLLAAAVRRRGADPGADPDPQQEVRLWIVGLGIVFPVSVLAVLLGYGLWVGEGLRAPGASQSVAVTAQAKRWRWTFGYASRGVERHTRDVLHIPAGRPVEVRVTTSDVIHSFWVPRLAGKIDAIPGRVNRITIEADAPGIYAGRSAEFSGSGYLGHTFTVVAHDEAGWSAFLRDGAAR